MHSLCKYLVDAHLFFSLPYRKVKKFIMDGNWTKDNFSSFYYDFFRLWYSIPSQYLIDSVILFSFSNHMDMPMGPEKIFLWVFEPFWFNLSQYMGAGSNERLISGRSLNKLELAHLNRGYQQILSSRSLFYCWLFASKNRGRSPPKFMAVHHLKAFFTLNSKIWHLSFSRSKWQFF